MRYLKHSVDDRNDVNPTKHKARLTYQPGYCF